MDIDTMQKLVARLSWGDLECLATLIHAEKVTRLAIRCAALPSPDIKVEKGRVWNILQYKTRHNTGLLEAKHMIESRWPANYDSNGFPKQ